MSDTLTITLLGSPQIALNGQPLRFGSVKAIALLAYISVSGMLHDRAELAALLWPESDNARARGALRYTLSRIKKELGDDFLIVTRRQIGMNPQADWTADVVTMRRLLASALGPENELTDETVGDVEKGVDLYQADFLQGFSLRDSEGFYEWSFIQGEALRRDLATALKRLAAHHHGQEQWNAAIAYAHRWLNLDPLHEPAHCQLMQLYADSGEWTAVHNQYQALTDLLEAEMGAPPLTETTALYQQLCQMREMAASLPATGSGSAGSIPLAELSPAQRSRRVLMEKVRRFWVDGLLTPLRDGETFINLELQFVNDAIEHPWADVIDAQQNPDAANIYHAFRNADRSLLILGAPGSGKTINLVELASYLLAMAGDDEHQPVPVILNLSGWAEKQMGIGEWAVEEMIAKYQIPRRMGRAWLADDRLLFLLDGLDEMPANCRAACIVAINEYRQAYGLADMAVCCRQEVYDAIVRDHDVRLQVNGAVLIRPLTSAQIREHASPSLSAAIFADETLLEIAHSPLNLSMMQTAFNGDGARQETTGSEPAQGTPFTRDRLFDHYVRRMFQRQEAKGGGDYASDEVSDHLTWLAQRMQGHNQSIFLLEQLQPSWLEKGRSQWSYLFWSHALMPAVLGAFIMWSFIRLIGSNPPYIEVAFVTRVAAVFGIVDQPWNTLFSMFWLNLFAGMLAATVSGIFFLWRRRRGDAARIDRGLGWLQLMVVGSIAWLAVTIPISVTDALPLALFMGGMAALGQTLTFGGPSYGQSFRTDIRIRGALKWSWRGAVMLGAVGAALSLVWSGVIWLNDPSTFAGGLNLLNMGLLFFLLGGLSDKRPEIRNRPNEGMRIAGRNGLKATVVVAVPAMILTGLTVSIASGLYTGLMLGLFAGVVHGFNDVGKHGVVRLLLWREGRIPLNYIQLLDCAADCVLLQRVGGGYMFRHRLLQEYFADREWPITQKSAFRNLASPISLWRSYG